MWRRDLPPPVPSATAHPPGSPRPSITSLSASRSPARVLPPLRAMPCQRPVRQYAYAMPGLSSYRVQPDHRPQPRHRGFPQDCSLCHSTAHWLGAVFDHSKTVSRSPARTSPACATCHSNGAIYRPERTCASCHLKDFKSAASPNHVSERLPPDLRNLPYHRGVEPGFLQPQHHLFPLTGAHVSVPCASCHVANNYIPYPTDCYSCHKTDYPAATIRITSGFPTTCATCHTTTTWAGATFTHTGSPSTPGRTPMSGPPAPIATPIPVTTRSFPASPAIPMTRRTPTLAIAECSQVRLRPHYLLLLSPDRNGGPMMRVIALALLLIGASGAQETRPSFRIKYVAEGAVYIEGGRAAGSRRRE